MSLNCPRCSKWLKVEDIVVRSVHHATRVETCGRVFVDKKGWMMAGIVIAGDGIEVLGTLTAREVRTDIVLIGAKGKFKGDLTAGKIHVEPGGVIEGGAFRIGA